MEQTIAFPLESVPKKNSLDNPDGRGEGAEGHGGVDDDRSPKVGLDPLMKEDKVQEGEKERAAAGRMRPSFGGARGGSSAGEDFVSLNRASGGISEGFEDGFRHVAMAATPRR
ncbi:hypothetical protein BHM03_00041565 [Ensete ventricosum]|nr:hypothetical protein BHM03_00041565 [Ensete ventricosum]